MATMAKLTSKNQLTLPKDVVGKFPDTEYFDVSTKGGRIILTPLRISKADAVREKLAKLGVTREDVGDAVSWARRRR